MNVVYEITDHTRGHTVRSHDAILVGHLHLLWLIWGHIVTLTRIDAPTSSDSPSSLALGLSVAAPARPVV